MLVELMAHPSDRSVAWTVRELALVAECSTGTIGYLRTGDRATVDARIAGRVAHALGVPFDQLFAQPLPSMRVRARFPRQRA